MSYAFVVALKEGDNEKVLGRFWTREEADICAEEAIQEKLMEMLMKGCSAANVSEETFGCKEIISNGETQASVIVTEEECR